MYQDEYKIYGTTNLDSHHISRKFIINLSTTRNIYNKYSYEECYRMYYNLCMKNKKNILNEWISECINSIIDKKIYINTTKYQ